jgi:hypothetical protein
MKDKIFDWFDEFRNCNNLDMVDTRDFWESFHDFFMQDVMLLTHGIHTSMINFHGRDQSRQKLSGSNLIHSILHAIRKSPDQVKALNQVLDRNNQIYHVECLQDFKFDHARHYSPSNIAAIANEYFISRMNLDFIVREKRTPHTYKEFVLSVDQVEDAIMNLKSPNASGILLMSGKMLQITLEASATVLYYIYKRSIAQGVVPMDWRYTVVALKHKDGATDHIENYRPIGTTCVASKVYK